MSYLYITTIFISSYLLFMVQPLFTQKILPLWGGGASIWVSATLFFQVLLFAGYLYAHYLLKIARHGFVVHAIMLLILFSVTSSAPLLDTDFYYHKFSDLSPVVGIFMTALSTVGLAFFMFSTTATLIQGWLSTDKKDAVYKLYAFSNAASLLALISYPFLWESYTDLSVRIKAYQYGMYGYIFCMILFCFSLYRRNSVAITQEAISQYVEKISVMKFLFWVLLSFTSSTFLSASTYHLTQDLLPMPLLWLLPLAIYLLSFILASLIQKPYTYKQWEIIVFLAVFLCILIRNGASITFILSVVAFSLFVLCYLFHAELFLNKPDSSQLSYFYVAIALGGVLAAVFSGIVFPYYFGLANFFYTSVFFSFFVLMIIFCYRRLAHKKIEQGTFKKYQQEKAYVGIILEMLIAFSIYQWNTGRSQAKYYHNFYGSLQLITRKDVAKKAEYKMLVNGTTIHGFENLSVAPPHQPTGYYHYETGLKGIVDTVRQSHPLTIRVIGLGVGALAAYAQQADHVRFYEINPLVEKVATEEFSYLKEARQRGADIKIVLGDARLRLKQEINVDNVPKADLLILDAFNSDSIPAHLLTREALEIYQKHLSEKGTLLIHISHRYIDLRPVLFHFAKTMHEQGFLLKKTADTKKYPDMTEAEWIVITKNVEIKRFLLNTPFVDSLKEVKDVPIWTDSFHSLHCLWKNYACI